MLSQQQDIQSHDSRDFIIAEYNALREEILKLCELQHQIIALALLSFGTLMGVGLQSTNTNSSIILIYPVLALFLAAAWLTHAYGIDMLGHYIENHIETHPEVKKSIQWESCSRKTPIPHTLLAFLAHRGLFPATQLMALFASLSLANVNFWMFGFALLCTVICIVFLVVISWAQRDRKRLALLLP